MLHLRHPHYAHKTKIFRSKLDLSNYATKSDFKNAADVDTLGFAKKKKKNDLANLKPDADKLDVDKLKNVPNNLSHLKNTIDKLNFDKLASVLIDLNKPSDVVKNDVVKKDVCNSKIKTIEGKILDIISLATTVALNTKINEIKGKIPSITNLATNYCCCFTAVENKIPHVSNSVKKMTIAQKLVKLKIKLLLIMNIINILLLKN